MDLNEQIFRKNFEKMMKGGNYNDFKFKYKTLFNVIMKSMDDVQKNKSYFLVTEKHPIETHDNGAPLFICPNCKNSEVDHEANFCIDCGVRLKWE